MADRADQTKLHSIDMTCFLPSSSVDRRGEPDAFGDRVIYLTLGLMMDFEGAYPKLLAACRLCRKVVLLDWPQNCAFGLQPVGDSDSFSMGSNYASHQGRLRLCLASSAERVVGHVRGSLPWMIGELLVVEQANALGPQMACHSLRIAAIGERANNHRSVKAGQSARNLRCTPVYGDLHGDIAA